MYLMDKHLQLIIVLVRLRGTVLVPFSRIYTVSCKFHSFTSPEPGLCVRVQILRMESAVKVERPSASAAYAKAIFTVCTRKQTRALRWQRNNEWITHTAQREKAQRQTRSTHCEGRHELYFATQNCGCHV